MTEEKPPKCPKCDRVLFNRLHDYCMWCGAELPESLRLSEAQKKQLQETQLKEGQRRTTNSGAYHWIDGNLQWIDLPGSGGDGGTE